MISSKTLKFQHAVISKEKEMILLQFHSILNQIKEIKIVWSIIYIWLSKSMYSTSTNHDAYNNKRRCFSSMRNKPLSAYDPLAHRSRLTD